MRGSMGRRARSRGGRHCWRHAFGSPPWPSGCAAAGSGSPQPPKPRGRRLRPRDHPRQATQRLWSPSGNRQGTSPGWSPLSSRPWHLSQTGSLWGRAGTRLPSRHARSSRRWWPASNSSRRWRATRANWASPRRSTVPRALFAWRTRCSARSRPRSSARCSRASSREPQRARSNRPLLGTRPASLPSRAAQGPMASLRPPRRQQAPAALRPRLCPPQAPTSALVKRPRAAWDVRPVRLALVPHYQSQFWW
mmetsp:Transcript_1575/g.6292  ORF Transcript_1575/g.6292 Transcript_1575/m.6292 type:complete len:250 (+) Transcript_1575:739-1488(+)